MQRRLDQLTKPPGSLGRLEEVSQDLAEILGTDHPEVDPALVLVFAGDHGVVAEQVSPYPPEVTVQMVAGFAAGTAAIAVLARSAGLDLKVVAMGVNADLPRELPLVRVQIRRGTRNFCWEPALTADETRRAIAAGRSVAQDAIEAGYRALLLGDMGIGNTTSAAALTAALLGLAPAEVVGPGTGLDAEGVARKTQVVARALDRHRQALGDPQDVLARLGGLEILGMVGAILEAKDHGVPVILDGYITGAAALGAQALDPDARQVLMASHCSSEPGHRRILEHLDLRPLLEWGLHLGEASGAALAFPLIRAAAAIPREMATFVEAGVSNRPEAAIPSVADPPFFAAPALSAQDRAALYRVMASRRDIRHFLPDSIPGPVLARLFRAVHMGPSVGFSQPWDYIVVEDAHSKEKLAILADMERQVQSLYFADPRQQEFLALKVHGIREAPIVLVVTADPDRMGPEILGRHSIPETTQYSVVLGIQNLWLAARAEGLGLGWVSFYRKPQVRALLGIPAHVDPLAILCLGYTSEFPPVPLLEQAGWAERLPLQPLVHVDSYGGPPPTWLAPKATGKGPDHG